MARAATRQDPKPRIPDTSLGVLVNARPDRKYVWVDPNNQYQGVDFYTSIGYEVEKCREGGPKPARGVMKGEGSPVSVLGQVLMSIDEDEWKRMQLEGLAGNDGQLRADDIEKKLKVSGRIDGIKAGKQDAEGTVRLALDE